MAIGKRIRDLRKLAKIKQINFAAAVGVSSATASEWESGKYEPRISQLPAIAAALGVRATDLITLGDVATERRAKKAAKR